MMYNKSDDLDSFLLVKKRKNELLNAYEAKFYQKINKSSSGSKLEYSLTENKLNSSDQEIITHHLNLFLHDKNILREFLTLNENRLDSINDCLLAESFLESFEVILLNLAKNPTFVFKVKKTLWNLIF